MAAPVWVLSVDLQTKTATFQSGMADAAKSARSAFTDIKSGSTEMSGHVGTNMFASRHAIMAVSEAFGVQMPRAITALIAHVAPLGAALEAAFPFAAIGLGAIMVIEKLGAMHEAGIKLSQDQLNFGTAVQNAFNSLDQKLLQSGIKADELRNDHIGALKKQLELIDKQSMDQLVETFGKVAKSADTVFADLKSHWYTFGIGATGAKHALDDFQTRYDSLLAQGKDKDASDLLGGTLASAQKVLAAQKQIKEANAPTDAAGLMVGTQAKDQAAANALKQAGVGYSENEVKAQQTLVDSLQAQVTLEGKISALKGQDSANATATTGKELGALAAEGARQAAEHKQKDGRVVARGGARASAGRACRPSKYYRGPARVGPRTGGQRVRNPAPGQQEPTERARSWRQGLP